MWAEMVPSPSSEVIAERLTKGGRQHTVHECVSVADLEIRRHRDITWRHHTGNSKVEGQTNVFPGCYFGKLSQCPFLLVPPAYNFVKIGIYLSESILIQPFLCHSTRPTVPEVTSVEYLHSVGRNWKCWGEWLNQGKLITTRRVCVV